MVQDVLGSIEELARRLPSRLGVKRELKKLPSLLMAGESVLQLDTGTYAGTNGLVVATDQRIMFMLEGLTRSRHETFPYDEISSVRSEVGMMTGTCRLTVTTIDRQAEITNMSKAVVDEITEYIRQRAAAVGEQRPPAEAQAEAVLPPTAPAQEAPPSPVRREIEGANLFLVGAFNPAVLQPDWFASQGLISHEEAYVANVQTSHRDRLVFTTDTFDLKASTDQLVIGSTNPPAFRRLGDIVRTILEVARPPIGKLGLNNDVHFRLPSADSWEDIAQRLAPTSSWNGLLPQPRMRSLQFQGERSDGRPGAVFVRVEPSIRVRPGAYIQVNDHYEIANPSSPVGTEDATRIVAEAWLRSFSRSEAVCHQVLFGTT